MPTTVKYINKMQCVHVTEATEDWLGSTHATLLHCTVWREADTAAMTHRKQTVSCLQLRVGKRSWRVNAVGFPLEEMKMSWKWVMVIILFSVDDIKNHWIDPFGWASCMLCTSCLQRDFNFGFSLHNAEKWTLSSEKRGAWVCAAQGNTGPPEWRTPSAV